MLDNDESEQYGFSHADFEVPDMSFGSLPPLPPENISTSQLYTLMLTMNAHLAIQARQNAELRREVQELRLKIEEDKEERAAMLETWQSAKGVVTVIKFLGTIGLSIGGIYGAVQLASKT